MGNGREKFSPLPNKWDAHKGAYSGKGMENSPKNSESPLIIQG